MNKRRLYVIIILLVIFCVAILSRVVYLHVLGQPFFKQQGESRSVRVMTIPAQRGMILDRNGAPLAVTTPVAAIVINPQELSTQNPHWATVLELLGLNAAQVQTQLAKYKDQQFMYLQRQIPPTVAVKIKAFKIQGIYVQREYRRYYPDGEATAQLIGFTNIDGVGQEGLEAYYNKTLAGVPGQKIIERDLLGHVVSEKITKEAVPGQNITLSINKQIQSIAYQALKSAVVKNKAVAGSAVVEDAQTGEILAMVNMPSFNPNHRGEIPKGAAKNRAVTDVFEPGSTMKPFAMTAVLESGKYPVDTIVNTSPGYMKLNGHVVRDGRNEGELTLSQIIQKSSNMGISKLVITLDPQFLPSVLHTLGFGQKTALNFPGESSGNLPQRKVWAPFTLSTLAFGYGIAVTTAQLTQAYAILANNGIQQPLTLLRKQTPTSGTQVINPEVAQQLVNMLKTVVVKGGTGAAALVDGYEVAGKTGTVRKAIPGGYAENSYMAFFAGIIPADHPQLVMVIMVDDPRGDKYYGGSVAAPVFAATMQRVMPLLHILPTAAIKPLAHVSS